ncbi:HD domain-containing protein [Oceanihabitans sp. IOP_32]|uniref:Pycsar system effector family protein n=1 Tax=Oceanihabitans sp. IOP_32 TaxID=2529032 RepID=UPI001292ED39|nr:Pycsar system effector family protein [Oceanihabitans sp. IOP_32]QFZ54965.1 HD domain-containing protein [Oceanihabitans sp. IOP_32]
MSNIIEKTKHFTTNLFLKKLDSKYVYHNLKHVNRVVKSTMELIDHSELDEEQREVLILTAWLHDIGFTKGHENHEEESSKIASNFLKKEGYPEEKIKKVTDCILATKRGYTPQNILEKIIRDADCSHFGKTNFAETSEYLRQELALLNIASYSKKEWDQINIDMLTTEHRFYTEYAKTNWNKVKKKNLKKLIKQKNLKKEIEIKESLKAKYKTESPDRGIQTLFRVTLKNHLTLSDIADTKANILLSVNAIIISLVLSNLITKLDNPSNTYLIYPTAIFVFFSVVSMILAVLATRPNITSGEFTKEDVKNKKVNLLFFGNFHKMKLDDYQWAINELIKDKEYIYSSLTKDLYFLGLVLNRKYKILRWTYTIFIIGIIVSVFAYAMAFKFYGKA